MIVAYSNLPEWAGARKFTSCMTTLFMLAILATLAACGGGAGTTTDDGLVTAVCDPSDASTFAECGTVMIALTDADGDFLNYTVDVLSLKLENADGRIVETLPRTATGKLRRNYAGKNHFMRRRSKKMLRKSRGTRIMSAVDARIVKKYLPYV